MASPTVDDERTIRAIVGACEAAWNEGDAAAFTAEMAEDVDFINVVGEHHQGRATVERGHRHIFDTIYKESRVRSAIEDIRFIRPDVALVFIHARLNARVRLSAIAAATRPVQMSDENQESEARPTMVMRKDDGRWRIVAFQNTSVATMATARA